MFGTAWSVVDWTIFCIVVAIIIVAVVIGLIFCCCIGNNADEAAKEAKDKADMDAMADPPMEG